MGVAVASGRRTTSVVGVAARSRPGWAVGSGVAPTVDGRGVVVGTGSPDVFGMVVPEADDWRVGGTGAMLTAVGVAAKGLLSSFVHTFGVNVKGGSLNGVTDPPLGTGVMVRPSGGATTTAVSGAVALLLWAGATGVGVGVLSLALVDGAVDSVGVPSSVAAIVGATETAVVDVTVAELMMLGSSTCRGLNGWTRVVSH